MDRDDNAETDQPIDLVEWLVQQAVIADQTVWAQHAEVAQAVIWHCSDAA